jgi:ABC-type transporter Mla subunit MlaD
MTDEEVKDRLRAWAGNRNDATATWVTRLASDLDDPEKRKLWAFVNLRAEFDSRSEDPDQALASRSLERAISFVSSVLPILYVAPILITWFDLFRVIGEYRDAAKKLGPGETLDFLALWSGANGDLAGLGFQQVALSIAICVFFIVVLHISNGVLNIFANRLRTKHLREIDTLLLDAQLLLAKSRAVTPEELSDSLTVAAGALEGALKSVAEVLPRFDTISARLDNVVSGLSEVSTSLGTTASRIAEATTPLADLPERVKPLLLALDAAQSQLQQLSRQFSESQRNAVSVIGSLANLAQDLSTAVADIKESATNMTDRIGELIKDLSNSVPVLTDIPKVLADYASRIEAVARQLELTTPVAIAMKEGASDFHAANDDLRKIVNNLREAADIFARVNDEYRSQE